jgi:hypothetical protein
MLYVLYTEWCRVLIKKKCLITETSKLPSYMTLQHGETYFDAFVEYLYNNNNNNNDLLASAIPNWIGSSITKLTNLY